MKRAEPVAARQILAFVDPTSVTVQPSSLAARTAATSSARPGDGRGDDRQLRTGKCLRRRGGGLVDSAPLDCDAERRLVRIEADDRARAGPLRGEADRGADQTGAQDREPVSH